MFECNVQLVYFFNKWWSYYSSVYSAMSAFSVLFINYPFVLIQNTKGKICLIRSKDFHNKINTPSIPKDLSNSYRVFRKRRFAKHKLRIRIEQRRAVRVLNKFQAYQLLHIRIVVSHKWYTCAIYKTRIDVANNAFVLLLLRFYNERSNTPISLSLPSVLNLLKVFNAFF